MAKGNEIIVSDKPRGVFHEGTIRTAEYPGTAVQIDVSEGLNDQGRPQWEVFDQSADGEQRLIAILLPDQLQGKAATTAYAAGDHCFVYCPVAGEELNILLDNITGTSDAFSFGDLVIINDGTGKFIATASTPESEPFQLLEAVAAMTADTLAHAMFTGY